MKYGISNIALPQYDHRAELFKLREMGFEGLEVAPSRVWNDTLHVSFSDVQYYRRLVEKAGLTIIGLHSLFFDQPELGLFRGQEVTKKTLNFLVSLSKICSDLGGKILVFGSPEARKKDDLTLEKADKESISFFTDLAIAIESHETCFCIEPLRPDESDYIHTVMHALKLTQIVNRKTLKSQIDAKAISKANEANTSVFQNVRPTLVHFHANDPGLGVLGETGEVNHQLLGRLLNKIGYQGYVSIEQRMIDELDLLTPIKKSFEVLKECYL